MPSSQCAQRSEHTTLPAALFRAWATHARPGEWFEYYRGRLAIDRVKGPSSLSDPERRKLNAIADHALALAGQGKLHLLQQRHRAGDYSYWAVARTSARSIKQAPNRLPSDQPLQPPMPMTSTRSVSKRAICEAVKGR
jgi:uncharacterized protein YjiS (DUF1127 family)